jgi:hypothetical protein
MLARINLVGRLMHTSAQTDHIPFEHCLFEKQAAQR